MSPKYKCGATATIEMSSQSAACGHLPQNATKVNGMAKQRHRNRTTGKREDPEKDQPQPRASLGAIDRRPTNHSERKFLDIVDNISYQRTKETHRVHCALSKISAVLCANLS